MAIEIIMPKAGVAMEEGTIIKWLKAEGETVKTGDPILEITTDKVNMEVEAEADGILAKHLHGEGEVLPVFTAIGLIGGEDEDLTDEVLKYMDFGDKESTSSTSGIPEVIEEALNYEASEKRAERPVNSDVGYDYDIVVLGGGPGGYVAAIKGAMLGGKVALVERDTVGGTCLNRGCIPTKTYVKNAEIVEEMEKGTERGLIFERKDKMDVRKAIEYKNKVVNTLTGGVKGLLKSHDIKVFNATGTVNESHKVVLDDGKTLTTESIILANGSRVRKLPIPGIDNEHVLTSTELLDLEDVPETLAIVGGGVIGCEFAEIFRSRGAEVIVIEMADRILPMMDKDLGTALGDTMKRKGIDIQTGCKVEAFEGVENGVVIKMDGKTNVVADKVLFAIGRQPNFKGIENLNLKLDKGAVAVNERMETSLPGIYAVGDLTGTCMLAHAAFKMGEVAAVNAMGTAETVNLRNVPSAVYTLPEVGSVGMTEDEARQKYEVKVGKFQIAGNGRALASGDTEGFVKVVADKRYGEILGIHIIGQGAAELINQGAALMALEVPADEGAALIFGHPCVSETLMEALADVDNNCVHLPRKR